MQTCARSARQLAREAAEKLKNADVPEAVASAEILLAELLEVRRGEIAFHDKPLTSEQMKRYEDWISRRLKREPVQRILGYAYFRNLVLDLNEETLIPRPDTESVVEAALERIDLRGSRCRVLDIGTGSGAFAISIAQERPLCEVHATDISEGALEIAHRNAKRNKTAVSFHRANVAYSLEFLHGTVDLLVTNPPYIKCTDIMKLAIEVRDWDPRAALDGGLDGLDFYRRRIFAEVPPLLAEGADLVLEVGDGQAETVLELGRCAGYEPLGTHPDLTGTPRAVWLRWGS
jgi:release factor glutamine methyltransferase